jgi:hypothetical protein
VYTHADIPKLAPGNRMAGTAKEYKAIVQGPLATYETYMISADGKELFMKAIESTW